MNVPSAFKLSAIALTGVLVLLTIPKHVLPKVQAHEGNIPATAGDQVPFKGSMQGRDVDSPGPLPNTITVTTTGTGIATHLGEFSFTEVNIVNILTGTATGTVHYVAANGDTIDSTFMASGEPTDNGLLKITEVHSITGGTGRFARAQGSFTVDRLASPTTFLTSGSFHGTITSPGAAN